jgi:hypothetical protein
VTAVPPTDGPLAPYCTGDELAAHIGGAVSLDVATSCAYAASAAVWPVVADPGWDPDAVPPVPVPEGVHRASLLIGAEIYKAGNSPGGEYQLDAYGSVPAFVTSNLVRKYGAMLAPWARVAAMVG